VTARCNAYGAENKDGIARPFGGFLANSVAVQPICENHAAHRFTWVCDCGHKGTPVSLCEMHYSEFNGVRSYKDAEGREQETPWNIRRDVRACPRCASEAPEPEQQHKCKVRLVTVS
jgi:hypothetical protein